MSQERLTPAKRLALIRSRAIALRIKYRARVARQHACNCKTCRPVERSEPVSLEEILDVLAKPWARDEPAAKPEVAPRRFISVRRMSRRRKDPPPSLPSKSDMWSRFTDPQWPKKCKGCGLHHVMPRKRETFLRNGVPTKVPHGILIPTCAACGVENIDAELAWRLDGELARAKQGAKTPPEYSGGCPVIDEAPQRIQSISALCAEAEQLAQEMIRSCAKALDAWLEEENER